MWDYCRKLIREEWRLSPTSKKIPRSAVAISIGTVSSNSNFPRAVIYYKTSSESSKKKLETLVLAKTSTAVFKTVMYREAQNFKSLNRQNTWKSRKSKIITTKIKKLKTSQRREAPIEESWSSKTRTMTTREATELRQKCPLWVVTLTSTLSSKVAINKCSKTPR